MHLRGTTEQPAVLRFRIEGARHVNAGDLEAHLATQESQRSPPIPVVGPILHQAAGAREELAKLRAPPPVPIFGSLVYALRGSGKSSMVSPLDRDQLEVDLQRVVAYYRDHGYYDARVAEHAVVPVGEGQVDVWVRVEEGPPVRVTRVEIEGLDQVPEARAAVAHPALKVGDVFTVAAYDALRGQLEAALHNHGWALGEVTQEAHVLPEEHAATVRYEVRPGQRFRFGPILVAGTGSVPRERVRRRAGQEIKPGEWFAEDKLALAQSRVYGLGVFGGVRVNRGTPDEQRGIIPVLVSVREAPFRTVRIGPSAGVLSSSRVDLSGVVGWTHRNFLGDLRKLDLSLTAGYAWLLAQNRSGLIAKLSADLTQPGVLTDAVDLAMRPELERGLEQGYDFWAERFRLALPVRLTRRLTFVPSYSLEVYELYVQSTFTPNDATQQNPILVSCQTNDQGTPANQRRALCLLSYLEQKVELDLRDDPLNTHRGAYLSFSVQEGGHVGGFGYRFLRFLPEARGYLPLGGRFVLAGRAKFGAFVPVGESTNPPTVALFESGGPNSMRGYGLDRLSPMACVTDSTGNCTNTWVPVGGNGLAEYSLELRFPLGGQLFGAAFTDAGYVSYASKLPSAYRYALDPQRLQWAAGLGIRYRTPIGPIRLDLASRIPWSDTVPRREDQITNPELPVHREPSLALQLSVGEAF
ncbi:MAG TPA: BamA/TamA family outer membrane protein [Anaeromyxobacter sp.]|nr:BamA/TamA family outer membrane protein [Anaeromyxobacter sp.]